MPYVAGLFGRKSKIILYLILLPLPLDPFILSVANAGIFSSSSSTSSCSGKTVPRDVCALLYDEEDCGGWEHEVPIGYSELPRFSLSGPKKNDAESVLVRPGCKFIGKMDS